MTERLAIIMLIIALKGTIGRALAIIVMIIIALNGTI